MREILNQVRLCFDMYKLISKQMKKGGERKNRNKQTKQSKKQNKTIQNDTKAKTNKGTERNKETQK